MKRYFAIAMLMLGMCLGACSAFGQTIVPSDNAVPANAVRWSTKPIISVGTSGHWVSLDKSNPVAGFSYSEINCDKTDVDDKGSCSEDEAHIIPHFDFFQVSADHTVFTIVSWRADGLTARYVGGLCHIAHTLEIDFKTGGVLITDSPTKMGAKDCPTGSYTYRLMEGEAFTLNTK